MARQRKTGLADDLFELVAMLPWWAGVALALVAHVFLHAFAGQQVTMTGSPGHLGSAVVVSLWKSLASVGQYVLPFICLIAALGSALGRRKREALVTTVTSNQAANALDGMTWREFEMLVGEAFRLQGYQVVETGGGGADGGVDLVLRKDRETFLVQCKQWRAYKVGVSIVRELFGVMAARGAAGGFVVTSGRFTREATEFASGRNLKLIEGPALMGLIARAQAAHTVTKADGTASPTPPAVPAPTASSGAPSCPSCGGSMIRRTAKRGANVGGAFWGCQTYPTCRGVRSIG
jgi:restriction system protein